MSESPRRKVSLDAGGSPSPSRMNSFDSSCLESEELLVASLKAARESMKNLDQANKELIEALESAQQEIERETNFCVSGITLYTFIYLCLSC